MYLNRNQTTMAFLIVMNRMKTIYKGLYYKVISVLVNSFHGHDFPAHIKYKLNKLKL